MIRLALASLRFRAGGFVASFVALFFGAVIVVACGALVETGIRGIAPPQRLAAAPLVVTGDPSAEHDVSVERVRVDRSLLGRVRDVDGVGRAVAHVALPISVVRRGETGRGDLWRGDDLQAYGWSTTQVVPTRPAGGHAPSGTEEVALDERTAARLGVMMGDRLEVAIAGRTARLEVSGLVAGGGGTGPGSGDGLYLADSAMRSLLPDPERVDAIAVVPAAGTRVDTLTTSLEQALTGTGATVLAGDDRGAAEHPQASGTSSRLISLAAVFGGIAVMVTLFVVGSTLGLLVQQRRRELALMRAAGALPGQVQRVVVVEALVVALLATGLAIVPGERAGRWILRRLAEGDVVASELVYTSGWIPVLVAAATSLLGAVVAALIASARPSRANPSRALLEAGVRQRWHSWPRLAAATVCLAGGTALALVTALVMEGPVASSTAGPAVMLWASAVALLSPGLTRMITTVLGWPLRMVAGSVGMLTADGLRAGSIRVAAAVTPVMLATGLATSLIYLQTSQAQASRDAERSMVGADLVVSSTTAGMVPAVVDRLASLPEVAAASAYIPGVAHLIHKQSAEDRADGESPDSSVLQVRGVHATGAGDTVDASLVEGSLADLRGHTVALPTDSSGKASHALGDTVDLVLGDGARISATVVALHRPPKGFGVAFLPADLLLEHDVAGLVPQVLVRTQEGVPYAGAATAVREVLSGTPGIRVARAPEGGLPGGEGVGAWINYLLSGTIIGYAVVSLVNALIVSAAARRRELALLRLVGATDGQVMRMTFMEAMVVAVTGCLLGTAVAAATLVPYGIALTGSPGPGGPPGIYLTIVAASGLLTLLASLVPTAVALRGRPAQVAT